MLRAQDIFQNLHGRPPRWLVAAPGRVNLIGEHVDYNGGCVLPMALEQRTWIAADFQETGNTSHWWSDPLQQGAEFSMRAPLAPSGGGWIEYVRGVLAGFQHRGVDLPELKAVITSNVPLGAGLSSSAALEVATATLMEAILGETIPLREKVLLCQKAEHDFAGVPCGIMDQFASAYGAEDHLVWIDCRTMESRQIPFNNPDLALMVLNTQVHHGLADGEYRKRREACEAAARQMGVEILGDLAEQDWEKCIRPLPPLLHRRAWHVLSEIERTREAVAAFETGDAERVGELMYASHASLRDMFEVSCRELDWIVDHAQDLGRDHGVLGCRMTGGGFGGSAVLLADARRTDEIASRLSRAYRSEFDLDLGVLMSRPSKGAEILNPRAPETLEASA